MVRSISGALSVALLTGMLSWGATAQETAPPPAEAAAPAPAPWAARCLSEGRGSALDCVMEQRVVMSNTGQLLVAVTIRMPAGSTSPVMMIQTPYGLYLPAGLKLAVGDQSFDALPLQTCDNQGCYAGEQVSEAMLTAMKGGESLQITFQDQGRRDINVPVSLLGFTAAFEKIQ